MENNLKIRMASALPHEQRVIAEANELGVKAFALKTFIDTNPIFQGLDAEEQDRLREQYDLMKSYFEVLEKRIFNFKNLVPVDETEDKRWFESEPAQKEFDNNSIGAKRVRVEFNPGNNGTVQNLKEHFARSLNRIEKLKEYKESDSFQDINEKLRLASKAQNCIEEASMWAVKAATVNS